MYTAIAFLVLACLILLVVGVFKPHAVLPKAFKPTKWKAFGIYFGLMWVLAWATAFDPNSPANQQREYARNNPKPDYSSYNSQQPTKGSTTQPSPAKRDTPVSVPTSTPDASLPAEPLELLDSKGDAGEFSTTITGRIRNNSTKRYRYVQVTFTLYNKADEQVGTALANINDLEPGAIWKYKATGFTSEGKSFKLSKITGF